MKSVLALAIVCLSSAFAQASVIKAGTVAMDLKCSVLDAKPAVKYSIKITTLKDAVDKEGVPVPASLTLKRIVPLESEVMILPVVYTGEYQYEDVVTAFKSSNGQVYFKVYGDELDQTVLVLGNTASQLDCN